MMEIANLDRGWRFRRLDVEGTTQVPWTEVDLPHCPFTPDLDGNNHWLGFCDYERVVQRPTSASVPGTRCALYVGAAMHTAVVLVDELEVGRHAGGYLPFEIDLTSVLADGAPHLLRVRLDNRDNPDVPPGKPFAKLDFCWYGGLYRETELRVYPPVHITDSAAADEVAGGGVFVRILSATSRRALVSVRTHVRNTGESPRRARVRVELARSDGPVANGTSGTVELSPNKARHVELELTVEQPVLWSPASPVLHEARIAVVDSDGTVLDSRTVRCGLRTIGFSRSSGFTVNGRRLRLRGVNRHQEFPRAGYAAPRAAQYRDAIHIKQCGFDYVRLSHYPQSPHFLDACDELGIVVMNAIPGWQFIGGEVFREACYENARALVRRDRNHPCVVLWELSLNETQMDEPFMERLHAIGHEEYPGDQMFTCGWMDRFDVYIHSRQHGAIHTWKNGDKAHVIAEYGDWEYFAMNAGFDQVTGSNWLTPWSTSRQFRGNGERALRQQAANHTEALDDTLASPAVLDGLWAMFDYARGYYAIRAAMGPMDVFRLPRFSYHFYRSQRGPAENGAGWSCGPMVFIASHWTEASDLRVEVFGNCQEVELRLNGTAIGRKLPDLTAHTYHLPHRPWVFDLPRFTPGTLEAVGYLAGKIAATHAVSTPGAPARLELALDDLGVRPAPGEPDLLIAHARICDSAGTLCVGESRSVVFSAKGDATLLGPAEVAAEAGIASTVLRLPAGATGFTLEARDATGDLAAVSHAR